MSKGTTQLIGNIMSRINEFWRKLKTNDKVTLVGSALAIIISIWAYKVSKNAYDLSYMQERSRIQTLIAETYLEAAKAVHIQKCFQTILGEPETQAQINAFQEVESKFSNLQSTIERTKNLDPSSLTLIETKIFSSKYSFKLDHYKDLVQMRFNMNEKQIEVANTKCLGDLGL